MSNIISLDIVSPEANIFSGEVKMIVATGEMGELGILPGHIQLLTSLKPGQIRITLPNDEETVYYVSGGLLEVQPYAITILADTIVRATDLDEAAAIAAREKAEQMLSDNRSAIDFTNILTQLTYASAKLRAINLVRKKSK